ncbi:MAG: hypothetical protein ACLRME_09535, partial [Faecalibacterium prausnitzii]
DSKHPSLPLARAERKPLDQKKKLPHAAGAPARSASHLTVGKNIPRATGAQAILKKKPTLPQHHIKSL